MNSINKKNKRLLLIAILFNVFLFFPIITYAQVWTCVGSACNVDEGSLSLYDANVAQFKFKSGTGTIIGRCNVTNPQDDGQDPNWGVLEVVYRDPNGSASSNGVKVILYRVSNTSGGAQEIATFESNTCSCADAIQTAQRDNVEFNHDFNFLTGAYYVELQVSRTTTGSTNNPSIFIVRLLRPGPD